MLWGYGVYFKEGIKGKVGGKNQRVDKGFLKECTQREKKRSLSRRQGGIVGTHASNWMLT